MPYLQNDKKFVAVLNRRHPLPHVLNGLCHATAGLAGRMIGQAQADFLSYANDADAFEAFISRYPFIVLEARNGNQLATLRKAAVERGLPVNVFISAMLGASAEEQVANTKAAAGDALDYMAVVLFGDAAIVDPLTRKFSLFKGPAFAEGVPQ
jgi:hypothetical protein